VLYILHGIGGDETEWQRFARVDALMDNLAADKKAEPMIVVMPNGRAQEDDRANAGIQAATNVCSMGRSRKGGCLTLGQRTMPASASASRWTRSLLPSRR
jgi:hypothetical protein